MALALAVLVLAPEALGASFTPGSDGLGDPMFPLAGNGGYDVSNYSLTLDYTPSGNRLAGTAVITARATQNLSRFDLDFRMQDSVTRVLVNRTAASYAIAAPFTSAASSCACAASSSAAPVPCSRSAARPAAIFCGKPHAQNRTSSFAC